jgi:hypothetical protein
LRFYPEIEMTGDVTTDTQRVHTQARIGDSRISRSVAVDSPEMEDPSPGEPPLY